MTPIRLKTWQFDCHLEIPAKSVSELQLPRSAALGLENPGRSDHDADALRSRSSDVEAVRAVEEFHSTWSVCVARCRHGIDDNRRFLALKFVDSADLCARNELKQLEDLRIIRGDDQDVVEPNLTLNTLPINPSAAGVQNL